MRTGVARNRKRRPRRGPRRPRARTRASRPRCGGRRGAWLAPSRKASTCHVDRGVATADHRRRRSRSAAARRLDPLDEGKRLPDPGQVVPWVGDWVSAPMPDAEEDGVDASSTLAAARQRRSCDAEPELDADSPQRGRFVRQRLAHLPVGRDRVPDEAARLFTLVEDRDGVAERGQLAGADEPGGAGADNRDPAPVPRRGLSDRGAVRERHSPSRSAGAPRSRSACDRLGEHAGALAQHLGRTNARARRTEQVLGEDRLGRRPGSSFAIAPMKRGHVDARGAGDHARRRACGPPHSRQRSASRRASSARAEDAALRRPAPSRKRSSRLNFRPVRAPAASARRLNRDVAFPQPAKRLRWPACRGCS